MSRAENPPSVHTPAASGRDCTTDTRRSLLLSHYGQPRSDGARADHRADQAPPDLPTLLQKINHGFSDEFGLLFLYEVAAVLNLNCSEVGRFRSHDRPHPFIAGTAHAEDGHIQFCIAFVVDHVLREGLIPRIASTNGVGAVVGLFINCAVMRSDS